MLGSEDEIPPKIGFPIFRGYVSFKMCIDVGSPRRTVEQLRMSETDCEILVMMAICLFTASNKSWKLYNMETMNFWKLLGHKPTRIQLNGTDRLRNRLAYLSGLYQEGLDVIDVMC